jgi:prepilin-type N-terminal cleavage/methylation domain-containing protein
MNNTKNKNSGFSLFELLLTIVLLSVLLCMGFNTFDSSIKAQNTQSATEQIASAIKNAKYYARSKGVVTSLGFPAGSNYYSISADGEVISNNALFGSTSGKLPENIKIIQNNCYDLNFYVDGSLIDSSGNSISDDCLIKTGYTNGPQKTITIKGNSGNVTYQ